MPNAKRMKAIVEAAIKRLDPKAIAEGTFYDDASGRLFVTIFKGARKIIVTLRERDFAEPDTERINAALEEGVKKLQTMPIG